MQYIVYECCYLTCRLSSHFSWSISVSWWQSISTLVWSLWTQWHRSSQGCSGWNQRNKGFPWLGPHPLLGILLWSWRHVDKHRISCSCSNSPPQKEWRQGSESHWCNTGHWNSHWWWWEVFCDYDQTLPTPSLCLHPINWTQGSSCGCTFLFFFPMHGSTHLPRSQKWGLSENRT